MPAKVPLSRWCLTHESEVAMGQVYLLRLVRRIADRDRVAFANLCDRLSVPLLRAVRHAVPDRDAAAAIVVATMMEVWSMARHYTGPETDIHAWLDDIVGRRVADRAAPRAWTQLGEDYDRHMSLVLAGMLGRRVVI